jgi:hypothetical protein
MIGVGHSKYGRLWRDPFSMERENRGQCRFPSEINKLAVGSPDGAMIPFFTFAPEKILLISQGPGSMDKQFQENRYNTVEFRLSEKGGRFGNSQGVDTVQRLPASI